MRKNWLTNRHLSTMIMLVLFLGLQFTLTTAQDDDDDTLSLQPARRFIHLTSDDGLVQNNVKTMMQDSNGFIWIGTIGGLTRYDGYNFINFVTDPEAPDGLASNHIQDIVEDQNGMIWIATEGGGVHMLNPTTLQFTVFRSTQENAGTSGEFNGNRHFLIDVDSRGHIWASGGVPSRTSVYDPATGRSQIYVHGSDRNADFIGQRVNGFVESPDQQVWLATGLGIAHYDINREIFASYPAPDGENRIRTILLDPDGNVWAGGEAGMYRYEADTNNLQLFPINSGAINAMLQTEDGIFWLGTQRGLTLFDPETGEVVSQEARYPSVPDSMINNQVDTIFQDDSGKIWMGGDNGLDIYDPQTERFAYYRHQSDDVPATLGEGQIRALHADDANGVWVASGEYLTYLDFADDLVQEYEITDDFPSFGITSLYRDHAGFVWIGGQDQRLLRFDPRNTTFEDYSHLLTRPEPEAPSTGSESPPPDGNPPSNDNRPPTSGGSQPVNLWRVISMLEDDADNLWAVLNERGMFRIDATRESADYFTGATLPPPLGAPPNVTAISIPIMSVNMLTDGDFLLSALNGYFRFDTDTSTYEREILLRRGGDVWVESSLVDEDGIIWFATREGLVRAAPAPEPRRVYTTADGLPSSYLVGILQAENGDLWISSKRGISRFDRHTETFTNFDLADGLQGNEFEAQLFAQSPDGRMYFGGSNGLTAFYPEDIVTSDYQPQVIIDDFELFNQSVLPEENTPLSQPIWLTEAITLAPTENIITFEFAALNYAFDESNQYRYQLEGLDANWNVTDSSRRFATYTNLSAGDYVFRVQATNTDGVWSENDVMLRVTIQPFWYETLWFRVLAGLSFFTLLFAGLRWRVRRIERRNLALQQEVERQTQALQLRTEELQTSEAHLRQARDAAQTANQAKSTFLANMSHELRSPLNAILGFAQLAHRNRDLAKDVRDNLGIVLSSGEHLLSLINQVLDLSKIEAGRMSIHTIDFDLYRLLDDLEDMFILMAREKNLTINVTYTDAVPQYIHTDLMKLRQTLINLLSNALKFTARGHISLHVEMSDTVSTDDEHTRIRFSIEDTGAGIPQEELTMLFDAFSQTASGRKTQEGTGLGLAISRSFVRLMDGDIQVKSAVGQGTTFTFDITCRIASGVDMQTIYMQRNIIGLASDQPEYRILVVDDKWTNRQLLLKLLEPLGFIVKEAENGKVAVALASSFEPHIILMDIRMPVMDGIEATRAIRRLPIGERTKIVALTASVFDENRDEVIEAGCDDFIRKPVQTHQLFDALTTHIGAQYVYHDDMDDDHTDEPPQIISKTTIKEALTTVPDHLTLRLIDAIELGDIALIDVIIDEISTYEAPLAETLRGLAQHFHFADLLLLLKDKEPL